MMAQDAPKSNKNARERRALAKNKADGSPSGSPVEETSGSGRTRREGGAVASAPKRSIPEQVRLYFKGVVAENKRVSWPGKPQVVAGTVTTLFILVVFSIYLGSMDWVLSNLTTRFGL